MMGGIEKPVAPSCERNRGPILDVLREHLAHSRHVLEIGSGTGQHAVHFAVAMPWLRWQCSDRKANLAGIRMWLEEAALPNTPPPIELDVAQAPWPTQASEHASPRIDAVFTANSLHIMGWEQAQDFFRGIGGLFAGTEDRAAMTLVVYGPFNYNGNYSSQSNRDFDGWLKARDLASGIRDFEAVDALARGIGLQLFADVAMPANNRCLVWRRRTD